MSQQSGVPEAETAELTLPDGKNIELPFLTVSFASATKRSALATEVAIHAVANLTVLTVHLLWLCRMLLATTF